MKLFRLVLYYFLFWCEVRLELTIDHSHSWLLLLSVRHGIGDAA